MRSADRARFELLHGRITDDGSEVVVLSRGFGTDQSAWQALRPWRISIGGTVLAPGDATVDGLLQRADAALYTAKRTGRDRVVFEGE